MDYKPLYKILIHKKIKLPQVGGIVCGYTPDGILLAVTEKMEGWPLPVYERTGYIHPDYEDNIFGFYLIKDSEINKIL